MRPKTWKEGSPVPEVMKRRLWWGKGVVCAGVLLCLCVRDVFLSSFLFSRPFRSFDSSSFFQKTISSPFHPWKIAIIKIQSNGDGKCESESKSESESE